MEQSITASKRPRSVIARDNSGALRSIADELMADGAFVSLASLARAIGCSYWTVYGWWKSDAAFAESFKQARQKAVDEVKEVAVKRAMGTDGEKPSDLMAIYILNNFDQEIVERMSKRVGAEITIRLEVPSLAAPIDSWAREVATAIPNPVYEAQYKELIPKSNDST